LNKSHSDSQAGNNLVHFTHPHSHTISPSLAHAHTHKRTHTHTRVDQSLTRIPATTFCTLMRKVELHGCACTKTHTLSLSLSFSPSLCLSVSLSLSLFHTHTHTHTHTDQILTRILATTFRTLLCKVVLHGCAFVNDWTLHALSRHSFNIHELSLDRHADIGRHVYTLTHAHHTRTFTSIYVYLYGLHVCDVCV